MSVTSKGRRWEILNSLWVGLTFTLSLLNWIAFLYIGFRVKQRKWILWGLFYSIPVMVMVIAGSPDNLPPGFAGLVLFSFLALGIVSIFHAFRVRREYLLRLETLSKMTRDTPITSRGVKWEILHSLWIGWTFTLFLYYIAFFYIGFRTGQKKWIIWGAVYLVPLVLFFSFLEGPPYSLWTDTFGYLWLLTCLVSIFHAFWIRREYLLHLEALQREESDIEAALKLQLEAEMSAREAESGQNAVTSRKVDNNVPQHTPEESGTPSGQPTHPSPTPPPKPRPVDVDDALAERENERFSVGSNVASYPLPLAYSYRLVEAEFETLRILKELYRNAEGLTAFLASLTLALAPTPAGQTKRTLLNAWRGKGATFGNWFSILDKTTSLIDEERGPLYRSTKQLLGTDQNPTSFAEDMRWLIDRRDEFHHGNLPVGNKAEQLEQEVRRRFQNCVLQCAALWQHPLRLVLDYDAVRGTDYVVATWRYRQMLWIRFRSRGYLLLASFD